MRPSAVILGVVILFTAPVVLAASGQQPNWPASISGPTGFSDLGKAIAAEPGFPRNGSDAEKARYISGKLPDIFKTYNIKAADPLMRPVGSLRVGAERIGEVLFGSDDPENTGALKGAASTGNCGEVSYAFSEILGGAGVNHRVIYGDTSSATGYGFGHGATDTTSIVQERTSDNEISRRVFDAYRSAFHGPGGQPTNDTTTEWNDLPLTDSDRLPKDDAAGTPTWNQKVGKPVIKDASSESPLPDVPDRFRLGSPTNVSKQLKGKAQADLNTARGMIKEAREAAAAAQAKMREAEGACASSDQAVMAAEGAKSALARAEGVAGAAANGCSSAPTLGEMEAAKQAALDAANQLKELAARAQPFVDEACKIATMAASMSDTEPYKSTQWENADAMAGHARILAGMASEALGRAREKGSQVSAMEAKRTAARDKGQEARGAIEGARGACESASSQLSAAKSACDSATGLLAEAGTNAQRAQERKSAALGVLNTVSSSVLPNIQEPDKTEVLGQLSSLMGEANSIAVPSTEGSGTISQSQERLNSAQASMEQARQKLAGLEQRLSACDALAPASEMAMEAMAAAGAASAAMQEVQKLAARAEKCAGQATARKGTGGSDKTGATTRRGGTKEGDGKDKGDRRRGDTGGSKGEDSDQQTARTGPQKGDDLLDMYRGREKDREKEIDSRRPPSDYGPGVYPGDIPPYERGRAAWPPDRRHRGEHAGETGGYKPSRGGSGSQGGASTSATGGRPQSTGCRSNSDCASNQYCNRATGKCITCPAGMHGKKDGSPACCKD